MTEELLTENERANHVRALERELSRVQAHAIKTASELIDVGADIAEKYAQTPEERMSIRRTIGLSLTSSSTDFTRRQEKNAMNDAAIAPLWEIGPFDLPQADMLSLNGRADRRTLSPRIRTLRMQARVMARAAHCPTFMRARLVAWVRFPDGRRRDLHNYMPTLKALVDGLVDAGLLPDDDARHLQGPDMRLDPRHTVKRMGIPMCSIRFTVMPYEENEEDQ